MKERPLVSVIMTTYNGKKERILTAIESIFHQTYNNIELIIVNDGSTNNIENILSKYIKEKKIIYIKNTKNLGCPKSSNKGISASHGKYIARIDDDDIRNDKEKIKKQVNFMEKNIDYGLVGVENIIIIDETGKFIEMRKNRLSDYNIRKTILQSNQFAHSSILIRRDALIKVGLYNENYLASLDYEIICRIGASYKFANLKGTSISYRINNTGITKKKYNLQYKNARKVFLKNHNNFPNFIKALILRIGDFLLPNKLKNKILGLLKKNKII